jgi:hypothetical protein
MRQESF